MPSIAQGSAADEDAAHAEPSAAGTHAMAGAAASLLSPYSGSGCKPATARHVHSRTSTSHQLLMNLGRLHLGALADL